MIHNLSYPYDKSSVNANIPTECSTVKYETIGNAIQIIQQCSPNAFMAKTDIADAFRLIPLHPSQYHLTGFSWRNKIYYDLCLPMGASSSCRIFERFSNALKFILIHRFQIVNVTKILDDFLFVSSSKLTCQRYLDIFIDLCQTINIPLAKHKTVAPTNEIIFLGIQINSTKMIAQLPEDKLHNYKLAVEKFYDRKKFSLKEFQSMIGKLQFATCVIPVGRCFLRRLYNATICKSQRSFLRMNCDIQQDLKMWMQFLREYNGRTIIEEKRTISSTQLCFYSDSSITGFGGTFGKEWIQGLWPTAWKKFHITILELYPIYILVNKYEHLLVNCNVIFYCDNQAVTSIINSQTSKDVMIKNFKASRIDFVN